MPKTNIDYSETFFYKIVCKDLNIKNCYVGHTTNFIKRHYNHKRDCCKETQKNYNAYVYKFIRENGGWENWDMILIEKTSCDNLLEACKKERQFIEELKANLNVWIPSRTSKERYCDKRDEKCNYTKEYYKNNIDKVKEWQKTKIKCECGVICSKSNLSQHYKSKTHINFLEKK